ncbi:MAG: hypothetical protein ACI9QD_000920 [Thermoproteota archaeon]|jgi:hypothetical protein
MNKFILLSIVSLFSIGAYAEEKIDKENKQAISQKSKVKTTDAYNGSRSNRRQKSKVKTTDAYNGSRSNRRQK